MIDMHPKIYSLILKCYYHFSKSSYEYFLEMIRILPLSKRFNLEKIKEEYRKNIERI